MFKPTVEDVIAIHAAEVGEGVGLRDRFALEAALEAPWQSAFGEDAYPTVDLKAAALYRGIDHAQPFLNGNKRTALLTVKLFYAYQGFDFAIPLSEGYAVSDYVVNADPVELDVVAEEFSRWRVPVDPPTAELDY